MQRLLTFVFTLLATHTALASQQDYPFKLINETRASKLLILAKNDGPAPILLKLQLTPDNAIIEPSNTTVTLIKPYTTQAIVSISREIQGKPYRIKRHFDFSVGDPNAEHDEKSSYLLPFANGQAIIIGQVLGGKITTHTGVESKYAIDFIVPIGTPVHAARKGIVVDIEQGYTQGGNNPQLKANRVVLMHEDGTLALYSHLSEKSNVVTFGQAIAAGQLLGYSGNTGYSTGPHLHFSVVKNASATEDKVTYQSIAIKFKESATLKVEPLVQGQSLWVAH